ncbi:hypothetical protein NY78_4412 [Desulfovibrio sp. TomC]|nr:hypothetical protein NY78_4412 [Desulfovibrio sp. TomC]
MTAFPSLAVETYRVTMYFPSTIFNRSDAINCCTVLGRVPGDTSSCSLSKPR